MAYTLEELAQACDDNGNKDVAARLRAITEEDLEWWLDDPANLERYKAATFILDTNP